MDSHPNLKNNSLKKELHMNSYNVMGSTFN